MKLSYKGKLAVITGTELIVDGSITSKP